jgi:hypothetical protein
LVDHKSKKEPQRTYNTTNAISELNEHLQQHRVSSLQDVQIQFHSAVVNQPPFACQMIFRDADVVWTATHGAWDQAGEAKHAAARLLIGELAAGKMISVQIGAICSATAVLKLILLQHFSAKNLAAGQLHDEVTHHATNAHLYQTTVSRIAALTCKLRPEMSSRTPPSLSSGFTRSSCSTTRTSMRRLWPCCRCSASEFSRESHTSILVVVVTLYMLWLQSVVLKSAFRR